MWEWQARPILAFPCDGFVLVVLHHLTGAFGVAERPYGVDGLLAGSSYLRGEYGPQSAEEARISRERIKERQELMAENKEGLKLLKTMLRELEKDPRMTRGQFRMRTGF